MSKTGGNIYTIIHLKKKKKKRKVSVLKKKKGRKTHNHIMKKGIKSGNVPSVEPYSNDSIN